MYTDVKTMTAQVNEMLELLDKAHKIADTLQIENMQNHFTLRYRPDEAEEYRPLTMEERIEEASRQAVYFESLRAKIWRMQAEICRNY